MRKTEPKTLDEALKAPVEGTFYRILPVEKGLFKLETIHVVDNEVVRTEQSREPNYAIIIVEQLKRLMINEHIHMVK